MINQDLKRSVLSTLCEIHTSGWNVVIVHGGGPFINKILDEVGEKSEFVAGHRRTSIKAIRYIEMALLGEVNANLVAIMNTIDQKAVGLSGKDGQMVKVSKRYHTKDGVKVDLGQVGNVVSVDTSLLQLLMKENYVPIIACIAADENGFSYNVNADMMAGAVAGALKANIYAVFTDVDGLQMDKDKPETLIKKISSSEVRSLMGTVIVGGMIPKMESCLIALEGGAKKAMIMNGTLPGNLGNVVLKNEQRATTVYK